MTRLNFSWLIGGEVAGHGAPLSVDDLLFLKSKGIQALVRLAELNKVRITSAQVVKSGFIDCYEPVNDFSAPTQYQIDKIVTFIKESISNGISVGVSCGAGIGRTGTILACYLVSQDYTSEQAIEEVKRRRGAEIETEGQKAAVRTYAIRLHKQ